MENRAFALATGIFVVLLTALLFAGAVWLSGGTSKGLPYDLLTEQSVAGLAPGAAVRLRGVEVGHVESVGFDPKDRRLVRVRAVIARNVPLMVGTYATMRNLGLSGSNYIELDYPDSSERVLVTSQAAPGRIPMRPSGLAQLTDSGNELVRTFQDTLERLDALLTPETARHVSELIIQINAAATQMTLLTRNLAPATRRVDGLLADADRVIRSTQTTVQDADALLVELHTRGGALDAVSDGARATGQAARDVEQALANETLPQIDALSERLSRNSDTLEQLLSELKNRPQSVIFGAPPSRPGPGEPGFDAAQR